jgi:hypothetical protein
MKTIVLTGLLLCAPLVVSALGVAPALIELPGVLQGSVIEQSLQLSRSRAETAFTVEIEVIGEAKNAIDVPDRITFDSEETQLELPVRIRADFPSGDTRTAQIVFSSDTADAQGQSIVTGTGTTIELSMSDEERRDIQVKNSSVTAVSPDQVEARWTVDNRGNVPASPATVALQFTNPESGEILFFQDYSVEVSAIAPFSVGEQTQQLTVDVPSGLYTLDFFVYDTEDVQHSRTQSLVMPDAERQSLFVWLIVSCLIFLGCVFYLLKK